MIHEDMIDSLGIQCEESAHLLLESVSGTFVLSAIEESTHAKQALILYCGPIFLYPLLLHYCAFL